MYTIISTSPRCRPAPVTDTSVMNSKKWGNFVLAQHTHRSPDKVRIQTSNPLNSSRVCLWTTWQIVTYQGFVFYLLADEFVFTEGVARLSSDGVDGSLFHLLLDGTVQHEQWFSGTVLWHDQRERQRTWKMKYSHPQNTKKTNKYLYLCCLKYNTNTICTCWSDANANLEKFVKEKGEPVCQHLLSDWLGSEMTWNEKKTRF